MNERDAVIELENFHCNRNSRAWENVAAGDTLSPATIRYAVNALKKQAAKPYRLVHMPSRCFRDGDNGAIVHVFEYRCTICAQALGDTDWDGEPSESWLKFCEKCGQKIDWMCEVPFPEFEEHDPKTVKVGMIAGRRVDD